MCSLPSLGSCWIDNFYYVETYKLLKKDELFYVSFDPEDETSLDISENDQDFILFGGFEGYYIDPIP
ncbi:hypothetical protein [Mucilaginibacter sp. NFX135]|uniref:hypothetical protein n=1 Tax=Mucilaginibacter sp. NFX135 TaxID=3402687 RepID=UPI003AFB389D